MAKNRKRNKYNYYRYLGVINSNDEVTVYYTASSFFTPPGDKKILRIKNNKVDSVSWSVQRLLYSAWTNNEQFL